MQHRHADDVRWVAPDGDEAAVHDGEPLLRVRHGVLAVVARFVVFGGVTACLDDTLDFLAELLVLRGFLPYVAPVLAFVVGVAGADGFEHVFCRVLVRRAFLRAVVLEVVD